MPRLLIVTTVPTSIPFFLPFADHFRRAGWHVDALTGRLDGFAWHDRFDAVHAVEWSRDPRALGRVLRAARRVREIAARGRYDLVHVHTPVASFVTRFALRDRDRAAGPQVVYTAHGFHFHRGGRPWTNAAYLALERLAARWTDWLVVINREDEAAARRWRFLPNERIRWMPGIGVDLRRYSPEAVDPAAVARLREELALGEDPIVLMVGEFAPGKRHADLVRAFAALCRDRSLPRPPRLLLAGRGPLSGAVRAQAEALGVAPRVHALGMRPDVPVLLAAAQVLVLPSDREGLPRCVLEAMAMGLPVVGTRVRGTAELLDGGCGALVEVGDVKGLAAAIRGVLADPAAAAAAARRALERVRAHDERVVIRLHEELYDEALGGRSGAAGPTRGAPERVRSAR
jgi:glycosyltransferase involved in cell wall biosynthesis